MPTESLIDMVPDVDNLLQLPEEELGLLMLRVAKSHMHNSMVHPQFVKYDAPLHEPAHLQHDKRQKISIALSTGWSWVRQNSLVTPADGINGNNGYAHVTRRGDEALAGVNAAPYKIATEFPKKLLHPSLVPKIWPSFLRGTYGDSVLIALRTVEEEVRAVGKFSNADYGIPLMKLAFDKDTGRLADNSLLPGERLAVLNLFSGAMGAYRNPTGHRTVNLSAREGFEILMLATHLLYIVDLKR